MRTAPRSVLAGAAPKPGKCLAVAATPPARSPRVKALPKRAAASTLKPKPRPSACSALSGRTTSTTGARSTFMPAARSVAAVARPSARATDGRPVAAISGALRDGAPGSRCTLPPSWSTMSSSGARRPAGRGVRRSVRVSARTCAGVPRFAPRKMTPAASPRRMRASSARGTLRPAKGKTTCWPASCASVSGRAAGEPAVDELAAVALPPPCRSVVSWPEPQAATMRATPSRVAPTLTGRSSSPRSDAGPRRR